MAKRLEFKQMPLPPDGRLDYLDQAFSTSCADRLFEVLNKELDWAERSILLFGRQVRQPRLVAFHGDPGLTYRYSGKSLVATGWTESLEEVHQQLSTLIGECFNSVLCNLYRNGADSMGWHADNESELGSQPLIASVSLGAERRFVLKRRRDGAKREIVPGHGSLLVMRGQVQQHWLHQVPRTRKAVGARINLTFRQILDHRR